MKNVVITGGSRGIGKALVRELSAENNVLVFSRNLEKLQEIQKENLSRIRVERLDLEEVDSADELSAHINRHFETVDVLINNAGTLINKPFQEMSKAEIEHTFSVNVFGLMTCCQAAIPLMSKGSHIVNIGSMGGFQGSVKFPGLSVYSSSKAAVAGLSEALAEELRDQGISVNCLALGAAQTEMLSAAFPDFKAPVSAEKMASYIANFALTQHQWINGKVIPVSLSTP